MSSLYVVPTRGRVNRAGEAVRGDKAVDEDFDVIDKWREAHRPVLNTFQAILLGKSKKNKKIIVA